MLLMVAVLKQCCAVVGLECMIGGGLSYSARVFLDTSSVCMYCLHIL